MMRSVLRLSSLGMLAGGFLAGCASTPAPQATVSGQPRSITLHHPASGETVSAIYRRSDGYDAEAMQQIATLFRDRRNGEVVPVDPALVDMLVDLRERCGASPDTPIHITSGFRSQATNVALARTNPNVAEHSFHMRGQAADIYIPGVAPRRIADEAAAMQRGGYAMYAHTGHVHVDTGPFRTWTPKGGEPRTTPAILEARATAPRKIADAAPEKPAPVAKAAKAKTNAKATPVQTAALPPAKSDADLSRVRYVLAQLKEQPTPAVAKKKP